MALRRLFTTFPEPVAAYRLVEGSIVIDRVNERFADVFGVDPASVRGCNAAEVVTREGPAEKGARIDDTIRAGEPCAWVVTRKTAIGDREFRLRNVPTPDASDVDGFAVYTDVTERERRQRELEQRNERLDEFASVVSHDLRNPLSVADGNVELARSMTTDDAVSDRLDRASDAIERMGTLIDDLLAVARRGAAVESPEPVDLAALASVAWQTPDTGDATLEAGDAPVIVADRPRVRQLLENLFYNAIQHGTPTATSEDGITVRVESTADGFAVVDDGTGFDLADPSDAFDAGVTTSEEGTGFGLRIVREIVDAHGWEISAAESASGGARFEITGVGFPE